MARCGMGVTQGLILWPTLGGWLTEMYNWRWVFFINVPIAILTFIGLSASLAPDKDARKDRFDILGFALLSVALLALQLLLDRGETKGWLGSSEILIEAGIFAFTFYLFIVHQRSEEHTYELQSLMRISYAVFCLKKNTKQADT